MNKRVFVVGMGVISPIGFNLDENLQSLRQGKTGIGKIKYLQSVHNEEFVAGEVKMSNKELKQFAGVSQQKNIDRPTLLSLIAAKEAVKSLNSNIKSKQKTALIMGNTLGAISNIENIFHKKDSLKKDELYSFFSSTETTEIVADSIGNIDFCTTINTACSSSSNAILYGAQMIKTNRIDLAIVGGSDALSKFSLNGFNSLFLLDNDLCKPFDRDRIGLNLGEGAGFLILASETEVAKNNYKVLAELKSYYNSNDAFHQTASSPEGEGAYITMYNAIKKANLSPNDISLIYAHGTATENNDLSEGNAIKRVFGGNIPPFTSNKSYIGHTLGAAGVINAVYSIFSILHNEIYPTINFKNTIPELNIKPVTRYTENVDIENVLTNSIGFGGNNTSLIFSKV